MKGPFKGEQGGVETLTSLHAVERVQMQLGRVGRVGAGRAEEGYDEVRNGQSKIEEAGGR